MHLINIPPIFVIAEAVLSHNPPVQKALWDGNIILLY